MDLVTFFKTNPAIFAGFCGLIGVIIGAAISQLSQWLMLASNRKAELTRRREDAYAKWIGLYTEQLLTQMKWLRVVVESEIWVDNARHAKTEREKTYAERKELEMRDECDKINFELNKISAKLYEAEAQVYMLEKDKQQLTIFAAMHETPPDYKIARDSSGEVDLEQTITPLNVYIKKKISDCKNFAQTIRK